MCTPLYSRLQNTIGTWTMVSASVWMSIQRCWIASIFVFLPRDSACCVFSQIVMTTPRDLYPSRIRLKLSRTNTSMLLDTNCLM